jgi:thiamine-monophosphate kinase
MKSEFQFIQHIKDRFSLSNVGDDCAVLPKDEVSDLLMTTDLLIQDVHFRLEWAKPADIGHRSLAVSLSDIAAMGGTPLWAMLSIGIPKNLWNNEFLNEFYTGWHSLAQKFAVELVGGDISSSPNKLVIDSIVIGEVAKGKAVRRSDAKAGDLIYVSGTLGAAAAGLRRLKEGAFENADLIQKQLRPMPQMELGKHLVQLGIVTSMIDISDGLSSDLGHICESSGVGARIVSEDLPIDPGVTRSFPDNEEQIDLALNGGEDFELLFTVSPNAENALADLPVTRIGTVTDQEGTLELEKNHLTRQLIPKGFKHF